MYRTRSRHKYKLPHGYRAQFDNTPAKKPRLTATTPRMKKKENGGGIAVWRFTRLQQALPYKPVKTYFLSDKPLNYDQYLLEPYWLKLRKEVLKKRKACEDCGYSKRLQLHHQYYYRYGRSVLYHERDYPDIFVVLCHYCHMKRHGVQTAEV